MGVMPVGLSGLFRIFLGLWLWRVIAAAATLLWSCRPFARCGAHHSFLLIAGPTATYSIVRDVLSSHVARLAVGWGSVIDAGVGR